MTRERREDNSEWPQWLHEAWKHGVEVEGAVFPAGYAFTAVDSMQLAINTLEGAHLVGWDDWIVQGVNGELYPVKPDIFEKTYDKE